MLDATTPPSLVASESISNAVPNGSDVSDALDNRTGGRRMTLPLASPLTESPPISAVTVQEEVVNTDRIEELTTRISTEVDTAVPEQVDFAIPQEDGEDSASLLETVTVVPDEVITTAFEADTASSHEVTTTTSPGRELSESVRDPASPTPKRVPTRPRQLVKCFCGGQEVLTSNGCQRFQGGTIIHGERSYSRYTLKPVAGMNVVVHDLHCDVKNDHRQVNYTRGQFYLRSRGDVLLLRAAGYLSGLRINNYCVTHLLDEEGELTWMMKACVPPPSVPTCCPPGHALEGGLCRPARTPDVITPLLSCGPREPSIEWPVIKNHLNPISCTSDPLTTIPIPTKTSYLIALPKGVIFSWSPPRSIILHKKVYPPDFCVDARQNLDGSVRYSANICYSDPFDLHNKMCDGVVCVRKCCKDGEMFNFSKNCISTNETFDPPFRTTPHYKTVNGMPLCAPQLRVRGDIILDERGYLEHNGKTFPPTDYCLEKYSGEDGKVYLFAIACTLTQSTWHEMRQTIFPICQVISLIFLSTTVLCYCMVPVLLQKGGWYQLCHVLSLMVAYSSQAVQQMFTKSFDDFTCIAMALLMQFSFLATFFWLSVLCFEVWRKIRSLNKFIPPTSMPFWVYPLYAFGAPFTIGVLTAGMQFLAPDSVPGVIKPYIGVAMCWFPGEVELFLYFYGPIAFLFACNIVFIALTYWNYREIEDNSAVLRDISNGGPDNGSNTVARTTLEHRHRRRDYITDFKQQFSLMVLMSFCWVTEILSWKIPPSELWALTDVLNTLQGVFIFVIFVANRSKRRHLKQRFPELAAAAKRLQAMFQKMKSFILCKDINVASLFPVSFMTSQISRKLSSSSVVSSLSTLSVKLSSNSSSFHVTTPTEHETTKSPSVREAEDGIIILSHSQLGSSSSTGDDTAC